MLAPTANDLLPADDTMSTTTDEVGLLPPVAGVQEDTESVRLADDLQWTTTMTVAIHDALLQETTHHHLGGTTWIRMMLVDLLLQAVATRNHILVVEILMLVPAAHLAMDTTAATQVTMIDVTRGG